MLDESIFIGLVCRLVWGNGFHYISDRSCQKKDRQENSEVSSNLLKEYDMRV